ncbi:hypothetical protein C2134_01520 [Chromobacterium sinusclupearum]|uniref:Uncharacterized protein n=1 Tax=Chromobacterium sinusclupearum TaxID=2077146 RepID=A0A2K4MTW0_9NEIS|nr:hypothetical protein [Chromobacterium sinusclupearum]POB00458.1 hypothetical protein C2134_01520 [Chromobacterium sinusclupearum]
MQQAFSPEAASLSSAITAPERPIAAVDGFAYLFRLSFTDVDFLNPLLSKKAQQKHKMRSRLPKPPKSSTS